MIAALQRQLRRGPLSEPFEPYARALYDHWLRQDPLLFHCRIGPWFQVMGTIEGFAGLREKGYDVVALDVEPTLVALMRCRGLNDVHQGDVFDFDGGAFDTILFMQATIGVVGTLDRLCDLFLRLKMRLKPRGQILLDSQSPQWWMRRWWTRSSGAYVGEIDMQLQYGWLLGRPFRWLCIDRSALQACADAAGYDLEVLGEGRMRDFLARLTPRQPRSFIRAGS